MALPTDPALRPIQWVYDPLQELPSTPGREKCICSLHAGGGDRGGSSSNCITIDPLVLRLPWFSSFCTARQCKHWPVAEEAAVELLEAIFVPRGRSRRKKRVTGVPREPVTLATVPSKERAIATAAVNLAIYLNPATGPRRIALITKVFLLAFLHHDTGDVDPEHQLNPIVDGIIDNWPRIVTDPSGSTPNNTYLSTTLSRDLISENSILGRGVMNGLLQYLQLQPRERFTDIRDFLNYRAMALAAELILACVRFANDIQVSPSEMAELSTFARLVPDHLALVTDLYSYEKGSRDLQYHSARMVSTVYHLEQLLSVEPVSAKKICLQLIEEKEVQMRQEMERLRESTDLTDNQRRYIFAMIDCVAGNVLFSLTSKAYGGDAARRQRDEGSWSSTRDQPTARQPVAGSSFRKAVVKIQQKSVLMMKIPIRYLS